MSARVQVLSLVVLGSGLFACSDVPAKADALATIQRDVKEEATCTLPINLLPLLKMQHTTKAVCVPRETDPAGKKQYDDAMRCLDALVAADVTKPMPSGYMAEWPDELSGTGFDAISPYERRARTLLFKGCVQMVDDLRAGQFRCGDARADKVVRISKIDATHVSVRYSRAITIDPRLASVEAACGKVTRPGPEASATFVKNTETKKWALGDGAPTEDAAAL
ncbi:MAG: hypothetical protein KIT84_17885 [Labilithrix sp.]|nr:hypothetical protein [Labilithrix sp.]MCW5812903.1 hypothetical protein [Labilithrix sp.]